MVAQARTGTLESGKTPHRLLEAAGSVFADRGFRGATVREICRKAGANVAAVNYHFRDKEDLYAAVLSYAHRCALEKYPADGGLPGDASPEERLRTFVRSFLARILDAGRPAWHGKLMAREMAEPTRAMDRLVEEAVRPNAERLAEIVRGLLGPRASRDAVRQCVFSIVGQCLYFHFARPVITRLHPDLKLDEPDRDRLADHIADFSLAALKGIRKGVR